MSVQIANINTLPFGVGSKTTISWNNIQRQIPLTQQMMPPDLAEGPLVVIYNESPCQFLVTLPVSGQTFTLPAGRWIQKHMPAYEVEADLLVQNVAGAALYNQLLADYYNPGEPIETLGVLGNSPIGGNALTITANQVIQDGQPVGQTIVEATPTGEPQTILMTTNGVLTLIDTDTGGSGRPLTLQSPNPGNGDDMHLVNGHDTTYSASIGVGDTTSSFQPGLWAFDHKNVGNIFSQGTKNGIIFNGVAQAQSFNITGRAGFGGSIPALTNASGLLELWSSQQGGAAQGIVCVCWSGSITGVPFSVGGVFEAAATAIGAAGNIAQVSGQATAGTFGVPMIVAQTLRQHVTTTAVTTILTYSVPANGLYRINGGLYYGNNTSQKPTFKYTFTQSDGTGDSNFMSFPGTGNFALDGVTTTIGANFGECILFPQGTHLNAGTLTVTYQDPGGTPNDTVSVLIERLA